MIDEPNCEHKPSVRVSSHRDLVAAARTPNTATASAYSCHREGCVQKARYWVQTITGKPCVIVPLPEAS